MQDLRRGVAPEIANAGGFFVDSLSECFGRDMLGRECTVLKMIILTVQAVKGAGMVKNRQVAVTDLGSSGNRILRKTAAGTGRANKITHTVRGQRIVVIIKIPLVGPAANDAAVSHAAQTAKPGPTFRYRAAMNAQAAVNAVISPGRINGKTVCPSAVVVNFFDLRPDNVKVLSDTVTAKTDGLGNGPSAYVTVITCCHNHKL